MAYDTTTQVTDDLDDNLASYHNQLKTAVDHLMSSTAYAAYTRTQSMTGNVTLTDSDFPMQSFSPTAARDLTLPTVASTNHAFYVINRSGTYTITIKNSGGTTIYSLTSGQSVFIVSDGANGFYTIGGAAASTDGWTSVSETWTYASASTITIPTDGTTKYQAPMKVRLKQGGGYKYYTVKTVAATLLTVFVNTDYTVANSAITDIAYSFEETPYGWPEWFNFSSTTSNITVGNGTLTSKYRVSGRAIDEQIQFTLGSTSAITGAATFSAAVTEASPFLPICWLQDSGTNTYAGLALLSGGIFYIYAINTSGTYMSVTALSSTVPYTWAVNDYISINARHGW